jgi:RNA polymerase sigma factor (sigma-70 family)
MRDVSDMEWLQAYRRQGSEPAFAALVERHINLVYSAALRHVGIAAHAEEITQAVFIILARKAASLRPDIILESWLHETTRLTALSFLRGERRRQFREQEAYMQSTLQESSEPSAWNQLAPLLDEAVSRLGKKDRDAVMLRFFKDQDLREVAAALSVNEAAAQRRVHRAVEKLRRFFLKRGVALSSVAIAGAISAHSVQAAPVALAATISVTAAKGATVTAAMASLVKGTLKIMTYAKLKLAVGISAAVLLAGGATMAVYSQNNAGDDTPASQRMAQEIAKKSQDAYAALSSYRDSGFILEEVGGQTQTTIFNTMLQRPNLYRIEWSQETPFFTNGGIVWSAGNGDFLMMKHGQQKARPEKFQDMESALDAARGISRQASSTIPETFFDQNWGGILKTPASGRTPLARLDDETIDGIDCYVLASSKTPANLPNQMGRMGTITTKFWIGKRDYFIHQTQTVMAGASIHLPVMSDSKIKRMLRKPVTPEDIAAVRKTDDALAASLTMPQMTDAKIKAELEKQNQPATPDAITAERNRLDAYAATLTLPQMTDEKIAAMIKEQGASPEAVATMKKIYASADKQAQSTLSSGRFGSTKMYDDIVVNQNFTVADFAR